MSRELVIFWAGRRVRDEWDGMCDTYRRRIRQMVPLRECPVRVRSRGEGPERLRAEGKALQEALPDPCWSVALDRKGKMRSSLEMADWLGRLLEEWPHPIAFVIGSDLGLADSVRESARESLSFGPLTLPHELARLVLFEQVYRSLAINAGIKYHRGAL